MSDEHSDWTSMHRFRRVATFAACVLAALLLAGPLVLYGAGLHGVEGRPQTPRQAASIQQQAVIWQRAHGTGAPRIAADDPYSYIAGILIAQPEQPLPSQLVTWWVARDYLQKHHRNKGTGWWHLSGAALTIWLSRNWTSEEILTAAAQLK